MALGLQGTEDGALIQEVNTFTDKKSYVCDQFFNELLETGQKSTQTMT